MPADIAIAAPPAAAPPSLIAELWHGLRENRGAMIGLVVVSIVVLIAIFADVLAPYSPYEQFRAHVLQPPVWDAGGSWDFENLFLAGGRARALRPVR